MWWERGGSGIEGGSWSESTGRIGGAARHELAVMGMFAFVSCNNYGWVTHASLHSLLHITTSIGATIVTPDRSNKLKSQKRKEKKSRTTSKLKPYIYITPTGMGAIYIYVCTVVLYI